MIPRRQLEYLVLGLLAAGSVILTWTLKLDSGTESSAGSADRAGYFLTTELTRADAAGEVLYRLQADRISQVPDSRDALLEGVQLAFSDDQLPWLLVADEGLIYSSDERVELTGGVVLTRPSADGDARILTDRITIFPERSLAETASEVTIIETGGHTEAVGMRLWLNEGRLELQSRVRGRYRP